MSNERSPRFPNSSLADALTNTEKLYSAVGRSSVSAEVSAQAIGYSGINGASRTALAALSYYGLIQREGDTHKVSELGLRLIRPLTPADKLSAARTAAERPPVFADIAKKHPDCGEKALASILLHSGFTDDGAGRAARVYKENLAFIESLEQDTGDAPSIPSEDRDSPGSISFDLSKVVPTQGPSEKMLAQYQIPLGANQAQLTFTGEELMPEDFDALEDYVRLFKQQFERKREAQLRAKGGFLLPPDDDDGPTL